MSGLKYEGIAVKPMPAILMKEQSFLQELSREMTRILEKKLEEEYQKQKAKNPDKEIKRQRLSGDYFVTFAVEEIYGFMEEGGTVRDGFGSPIKADAIVECWGEETRSWINSSFRKWADDMPVQRLQDRCLLRFTLLYLALKLYTGELPKKSTETQQSA